MNKDVIENIAGHFAGSRWLQGYVRGKLRTDPVYQAVLDLLQSHPQPVLDIGCGLGLLSFYLRQKGFHQPVLGLDSDSSKIGRAAKIAAAHYAGLAFEVKDVCDLAIERPAVVMLDVLHYLSVETQRSLLSTVAGAIPPGGMVIIRNTPRDGTWRYLVTRMEEVFLRTSGWIQGGSGVHFPTAVEITTPFRERGFAAEIRPLWGRTPFNSHLFVFIRPVAPL